MAVRTKPPSGEPVVDLKSGLPSVAWMAWFQNIGDQAAPDLSNLNGSILGAGSAATSAQNAANAAQATADAVKARMDAYDATTPNWVVGDYRDTIVDSLGPAWLLCDGSPQLRSQYPALAAVLQDRPGTSGNPATFLLPGDASAASSGSFTPGVTPSRRWIRAF